MGRTIVIVDQVGWMGHHPMYNKLITKAFLQNGFSVILICEKPEEVKEELCDPTNLKGYQIQLRGIFALVYNHIKTRYNDSQLHAWVWLRLNLLQNRISSKHKFFFVNGDAFIQGKINFWHKWMVKQWSGIYMFPHKYLDTNPNIPTLMFGQKIYVLDRTVIKSLRTISGVKNIEKFPDITNTDFKAVKLTKDKKVIGIFGGMSKRKGFLTFLRLAKKYPSDFQFLAIGRIIEDSFTIDERSEIQQLMKDNDNLIVKFGKISDQEFNGYIRLVDLCYCVYENFRGSSNILTKAAYFHIPTLGLKDTYIGKMIEEYKIGGLANSIQLENVYDAIRSIINQKFEESNYDLYYQDNCIERARTLFTENVS